MRTRTTALLVSVLALPALGALLGSAPTKPDPAVAAILPLYQQDRDWILTAAEQMPEEKYGFKATPEVRSFGEMIGHVATAQYLFCSKAMGEKNPTTTDYEKITGKANLTTALRSGFAYCDKAYQMSGPMVMEEVELFGVKGSRLWALNFNAVHNGEHYGTIVAYLRLNGMVPPSSQPSPPAPTR